MFQKPFCRVSSFLRISNNLIKKQPKYFLHLGSKMDLTVAKKPKIFDVVHSLNLVWVDCEMTGLNPEVDKLIEIAVIITDKDLNVLAEGPNLVIHQPKEVKTLRLFVLKYFVGHLFSINFPVIFD